MQSQMRDRSGTVGAYITQEVALKLFGKKNKAEFEDLKKGELKWPKELYNARGIRRGADVLVADVFKADPKEKSIVAAQQMAELVAL